ncbi:MAG: RtcB family protein, partial [Candidatus Nanopelagicales bacterium]
MPKLTDDKSVLSWASTLEPGALEQAKRTAQMPFVVKPLALMADAHAGKGSTVGSVIATQGAIIPAAVGVDIGCGMIAVETDLTSHSLPDDLSQLHAAIRTSVPAGVGRGHEGNRDVDALELLGATGSTELSDKQRSTARAQFGSLGSGNHFVEVCLDERDRVWVVVHSGSRGIGNQLAMLHIERATGLMKQWFVQLADPDLAYLPEGTAEFDDYIADMLWAQRYAAANRDLMAANVVGNLFSFVGGGIETDRINCHHNFTQREKHRGRDLWITRKGAIQAKRGGRGVIPGSMGTRSYIVSGLGSAASFESSSHGAGRRMSRSAARKSLTVDSLRDAMAGRTWNADQASDLLDEHPDSYKDIDQVRADQADLV